MISKSRLTKCSLLYAKLIFTAIMTSLLSAEVMINHSSACGFTLWRHSHLWIQLFICRRTDKLTNKQTDRQTDVPITM